MKSRALGIGVLLVVVLLIVLTNYWSGLWHGRSRLQPSARWIGARGPVARASTWGTWPRWHDATRPTLRAPPALGAKLTARYYYVQQNVEHRIFSCRCRRRQMPVGLQSVATGIAVVLEAIILTFVASPGFTSKSQT